MKELLFSFPTRRKVGGVFYGDVVRKPMAAIILSVLKCMFFQ